MSVNLEWSVPMEVVSPYGNLPINTPFAGDSSGQQWLFQILDPTTYSIVPGKFRATIDSLSQTDGSSIQPPYIDGMVATIELAYYVAPNGVVAEATPACGSELRAMNQLLMGVLNSLRTYPPDVSKQQYLWTPTGTGVQRLLDGVMLGSWPTPDFTKGPPEVRVKFTLASPYPYALDDAPMTSAAIAAGSSIVVTNGGNVAQLPILMIPGPASGPSYIQVTNVASGLTIVYDSTLPGAVDIPLGQILQIDFHEGSCLLGGNPDDNYIAGLNVGASDFWPLAPGAQSIANSALSTTSPWLVSYNAWT